MFRFGFYSTMNPFHPR